VGKLYIHDFLIYKNTGQEIPVFMDEIFRAQQGNSYHFLYISIIIMAAFVLLSRCFPHVFPTETKYESNAR
jgi:hypothetical protein